MQTDADILPGTTREGRRTYRQALIHELALFLDSVPEGETVTHERLMEVLAHRDKRYVQGILNAAAEVLKMNGVMFGSVHGVGYRRLSTLESISKCKRKILHGARAVQRGVADYDAVPLNRIAEAERDKVLEFRQRLANMAGLYRQIEGKG